MKKELNDYLFLYLGCECKINVGGKIAVLHTVTMDLPVRPIVQLRQKGFTMNYYLEEFKPLLRPLSDMTEEEIKEVAWILHRFKPEEVRGKDSVGNIKVTNKSPFYYWINVRQHLNAECCKYLLSKHFDLFELIEAGLAIDKTLTPTQNIKL